MKFEEQITPVSAFVPQTFDCFGSGSWGNLHAQLSHGGLNVEYDDPNGYVRMCVKVGVEGTEMAEAILAWFETDKKDEVPANGLREAANVVRGKVITGFHDTVYYHDEPGEMDREFYLDLIWDHDDSGKISVTVWNRDFDESKSVAEGLIVNFFAELKRLGVVGD